MRIDLNTYYVYQHSIDGKIFYIGQGKSDRPYAMSGRNKVWREIVTDAGYFDVEILHQAPSKDAVLKLEERLIKKHEPVANFTGNPKNKHEHARKKAPSKYKILDTKTDIVHASIGSAALATGVHGSMIYREARQKGRFRFQYPQSPSHIQPPTTQ